MDLHFYLSLSFPPWGSSVTAPILPGSLIFHQKRNDGVLSVCLHPPTFLTWPSTPCLPSFFVFTWKKFLHLPSYSVGRKTNKPHFKFIITIVIICHEGCCSGSCRVGSGHWKKRKKGLNRSGLMMLSDILKLPYFSSPSPAPVLLLPWCCHYLRRKKGQAMRRALEKSLPQLTVMKQTRY